jgi:PAS domain S-box-containing protein
MASNHLLKETDIDKALNLCIATLGETQNVDRCYIFKNKMEDGELKLYYVHEWCNKRIDAYLGSPDLNGLNYTSFPGLYETLIRDEPLYGLVKESPNELFKEVMEMQGIQSYLFTPIFSNNEFWGWIGYDDCKTERKWIENEVAAIHTVAKNIGLRLNQDKIIATLESTLEQFDFYMEGSDQGMWQWDIISNTTKYSYNWAGMLGYTIEEIDHTFDFWQKNVHPEDIDKVEKNLKNYVTGETNSFEGIKRMRHKKGHFVWIKYSGLLKKNNIGKPIKMIGSHIDISEIKEKENQLQISEEKFRFIAENTTDLICQHTKEGIFTYVSSSAKEIIGYNPNELVGRNPFDYINPDEILKITEEYRKSIEKKIDPVLTFRFKKNNNNYIWLETTSKLIVDDNNKILGFQTSSRDITERMKIAEDMKTALQKERELSDLKSKFVSLASHQFRTPLTVIYSNAELIDIKIDSSEKKLSDEIAITTNRIKREVDRMIELMDNILIFGKYDIREIKVDIKPINFFDFIENLIATYFHNENDGRIIEFSITGKKRTLYSDETLITHIVTNLISNAFKYSVGKPNPKLNISFGEKVVQLEIIDYGIGIPKIEIPHLFSSFYRATNTATIKGTGLGLVIVKQFTEKLKGEISLESEENNGTKINVILPYE